MRLIIAYSEIKKRNLVLINNDTYHIVGSGVRPPPFLFYPHPFYKGTLDTENSGPPPF